MIIRNNTTSKTATQSPLNSLRSARPEDRMAVVIPTPTGSPSAVMGHPFRVHVPCRWTFRGYFRTLGY